MLVSTVTFLTRIPCSRSRTLKRSFLPGPAVQETLRLLEKAERWRPLTGEGAGRDRNGHTLYRQYNTHIVDQCVKAPVL